MCFLRPNETADTIFTVDYDRLRASGKRVLLFDLDNTLGARGLGELPDEIASFLESLKGQGFAVGVLTNRRRGVDQPVFEALRRQVPVVHAAGKPARRGFLKLLETLGGGPADAAMIGDRRLTDVLGANCLGIHSIRVRRSRA